MRYLIDSNLQICDKSFKKTPQGYLMLEGIISRSGPQEYMDVELGVGNTGRTIMLERPIEEVTDSMSVASFLNMPTTDDHPVGTLVDSENFNQYMKGTVTDAEATPSGHVKASMIVYDSVLIKKIEDGKRELSAGYTAELEFSDDGKSAIQRKIRGNHVAFVDAARCGKECSIFDSKPNPGDTKMAKMKIKGVEYEMADSVVPAIQVVLDENQSLTKIVDTEKAKHEKTKAMLDAAKEKVKEMEDEEEDEDEKEKKITDAAHQLLSVLTDAAKIMKDYDATGKSIPEIKRDTVCDSNPELKDKSQAYIDARFDIMVAEHNDSDDPLSRSIGDSFRKVKDTDLSDSQKARKAKIKRSQAAYKGEK